jgi:hypothetical protein
VYPWITVTVAVYVAPAHEATRQWTVRVRGLNIWPQVAKLVWLRVRLILTGLLTVDWSMTGPVIAGAHLNGSEILLPENVMLSGFTIQTAFGAVIEAKLTAAYAPTIRTLIEKPTSR